MELSAHSINSYLWHLIIPELQATFHTQALVIPILADVLHIANPALPSTTELIAAMD